MKSTIYTLLAVCALSFTACHYGADQVKEDLKRNDEYKGKRAEKEAATALPPDAADKMNGKVSADTTAAADTAAGK